MNRPNGKVAVAKRSVRCAIYTRKSSEEGLQQEFNSLDAQRESAEAFISAQKHEGWTCLPDRYDDGGFTGGNMDRPALQRLIKDIDSGRIDCVVVYKVDRLSRSLMDFARMMQVFDQHQVSFVSVTQQFNTTHSMGRLTLNILLSFAQFEREIISERTRDKIAAARRKGKWSGGRPILGYDVQSSPSGSKLMVNEEEAEQVREIFQLYLKHEALIPTVTELNKRGWTTKVWQTKADKTVGGRSWGKTDLYALLTNVAVLGKVRYKEEIHLGEHTAIVGEKLWQRVQCVLERNGRTGGGMVRNKYGALLKGMLRCGSCDCSMGHTYAQKGTKRYRYYVCLKAQKQGWDSCSTKSIPAAQIEQFVVEQIRGIGKDPQILRETIRATKAQGEKQTSQLKSEERTIHRELGRLNGALAKAVKDNSPATIADLQDRIREIEQRGTEIRERLVGLSNNTIDDKDVESALAAFDPVWETLSPREQARIIRLLVERVDYDGKEGSVSVTFRATGIKALASERQEMAA